MQVTIEYSTYQQYENHSHSMIHSMRNALVWIPSKFKKEHSVTTFVINNYHEVIG